MDWENKNKVDIITSEHKTEVILSERGNRKKWNGLVLIRKIRPLLAYHLND